MQAPHATRRTVPIAIYSNTALLSSQIIERAQVTTGISLSKNSKLKATSSSRSLSLTSLDTRGSLGCKAEDSYCQSTAIRAYCDTWQLACRIGIHHTVSIDTKQKRGLPTHHTMLTVPRCTNDHELQVDACQLGSQADPMPGYEAILCQSRLHCLI